MKAHTSTGVRGQVRSIYLENVTTRPIHYPHPSPVSQSILFSAQDFTMRCYRLCASDLVISDPDSWQEESTVSAASSSSSCFKERSPVIETRAVSRTGLRNPRETSRFIPRIAMKIPRPKAEKSPSQCRLQHANTNLNESPRPKTGKSQRSPLKGTTSRMPQ